MIPAATRHGAYSGYLLLGASSALAFLRVAVLPGVLGASEYGVWIVLAALGGYLAAVSAGLAPSIARLVAAAGPERRPTVPGVLAAALALEACLAVAAIGAVVLLGEHAAALLNIPVDAREDFRTALVLVTGSGALRAAGMMFIAALAGTNRKVVGDTLLVGAAVVDTAIAVAAALAHRSFLFLCAWDLAGASVLFLATVVVCWKLLTPLEAPSAAARPLLQLGGWTTVMALGSLVVFNTDTLVIASLLGPAEVTPYAIAFQIVWLSSQFAFQPADALQPWLGRMFWRGDRAEAGRVLALSLELSCFLGASVSAILLFGGPWLIETVWGADGFVGHATWILLALVPLLHAFVHAYAVAGVMTGPLAPLTAANVLEASVKLTLSVLLTARLGVLGAALATLVAQLATNGWFLPWRVRRDLALRGSPLLSGRPGPMALLGCAIVLGAISDGASHLSWLAAALSVSAAAWWMQAMLRTRAALARG